MPSAHSVKLRPLEREDLRYVHQLDNNASVMRYWFENPTEGALRLNSLICMISIFTIRANGAFVECDGEKAGLVELVEIMFIAAQNFR